MTDVSAAASEGHLDTLKTLLSSSSCSYAICDNEGVTPEDEAKSCLRGDVADFLSLLRWENRTHRKNNPKTKLPAL